MASKYNTPVIINTNSGLVISVYRNMLEVSKVGACIKVAKVKDLWFDLAIEDGNACGDYCGVGIAAVYNMIQDLDLGWQNDEDLELIETALAHLPCMGSVIHSGSKPVNVLA